MKIYAGSSVPYPVLSREVYDYWRKRNIKYKQLKPAMRTIERFLGNEECICMFYDPDHKPKLYVDYIPF